VKIVCGALVQRLLMRGAIMRSFLLLFFSLSAIVIGCGGSSDGGTTPASSAAPPPAPAAASACEPYPSTACCASLPCIEADVTMPDGTQTHFAARGDLSTYSDGLVTLLASNESAPYLGVSISWRPASVVAGKSYAPDLGGGDVNLWVLHGDDANHPVLSSTTSGAIVFTQVATPNGTFDGISTYVEKPSAPFVLHGGKFRGGS
jgi:hypothetical protein